MDLIHLAFGISACALVVIGFAVATIRNTPPPWFFFLIFLTVYIGLRKNEDLLLATEEGSLMIMCLEASLFFILVGIFLGGLTQIVFQRRYSQKK